MFKGALSLAVGGAAGKVLGLAREALLSYWFGTSEVAAAARLSQTTVLAPMNVAVTDALSGGFLPLEAQLLKDSPSSARALYVGLQRGFLVIALAFAITMILHGRAWLEFIAPEGSSRLIDLSRGMLVAMALGAPAYLHANLLCYLEMAHNRFLLSSIRSVLQSVGVVVGIVMAHVMDRPVMIAWGFTGAYVLMVGVGEWYMRTRDLMVFGDSNDRAPFRDVIGTFLRRFRPLALIPVLYQAQMVAEKAAAASAGVDAIAAVDYARFITETGMILIAVPVGLASLPSLAVMSVSESHERIVSVLAPLLTIAVPLSAALAVFSPTIVSVLFGRGAFGIQSIQVTSAILMGMSVGLWAQMLMYFLCRALNARSLNTQATVVVGTFVALAVVLRYPLIADAGAGGLGWALSVGSIAAVLVAVSLLRLWRPFTTLILLMLPGVVISIVLVEVDYRFGPTLGLFALVWFANVLTVAPLRRPALQLAARLLRRDST